MTPYALLGEVLIGWLIADFLTGLVHWVGDSDRMSKTRLVKLFSGFNQSHHADPLGITRESFLARNSSQWIIVTLIGLVWILLAGFSFVWLTTVSAGLISGQVHAWAHAPRTANRFVHVCQEVGIFQSPKHHAGHHRPPHQTRYCVLTDYLNPVLDAVGFWRLLDRTIG